MRGSCRHSLSDVICGLLPYGGCCSLPSPGLRYSSSSPLSEPSHVEARPWSLSVRLCISVLLSLVDFLHVWYLGTLLPVPLTDSDSPPLYCTVYYTVLSSNNTRSLQFPLPGSCRLTMIIMNNGNNMVLKHSMYYFYNTLSYIIHIYIFLLI